MPDYPQIFELDEVAKIVGMPKSLAKNWTIGRPLKITPSVRTALGKGSRNLYGLEDVLKMALAYEMSGAGLTAKLIQRVLEQLGTVLNLDDVSWVIISSRGNDVDIQLLFTDVTLGRGNQTSGLVYHVIDFKSLSAQVLKSLDSLRHVIEQKSPKNGKQKKGRINK